MANHAVFGLIGVGGISQSQHLPNLTRAEGVRLKTVCDLREDLLKQMQAKYGVPHATTDHREVLADPEIDAVLIATREDAHVPLTVEALKAGKHVYVEKPLAETAEQARPVLEAQKASGKFVVIGHNRRFAPAYRKVMEILRDRGGPRHIHYRVSDAYWNWGRSYGAGKRVVHELCHVFDILRVLTGSEVASVYCAEVRPDDETIVLTFRSGCVASIMSTGYVYWDMPKERLEVILDMGALTIEDFVELTTFGLAGWEHCYRFAGHTHPDRDSTHERLYEKLGAEALLAVRRTYWENRTRLEYLVAEGVEGAERRRLEAYMAVVPNVGYSVNKGWIPALEHFAKSIVEGRQPELAGPEDGIEIARITEAVIHSRQGRKIVEL